MTSGRWWPHKNYLPLRTVTQKLLPLRLTLWEPQPPSATRAEVCTQQLHRAAWPQGSPKGAWEAYGSRGGSGKFNSDPDTQNDKNGVTVWCCSKNQMAISNTG